MRYKLTQAVGRAMFIRILTCFSLFLCSTIGADQRDPRLDELFAKLKQTTELSEGELLTQSIWNVWYTIKPDAVQELFDSGIAAMGAADFDSALEILTRVTELHPDFAEAWNRRATVYFIVGNFELSIYDIKRTLLLEPRHFGAISGLGQIYLRQNKLLDAREAFAKALEINPHLVNARLNVDQINKLLGKNSV